MQYPRLADRLAIVSADPHPSPAFLEQATVLKTEIEASKLFDHVEVVAQIPTEANTNHPGASHFLIYDTIEEWQLFSPLWWGTDAGVAPLWTSKNDLNRATINSTNSSRWTERIALLFKQPTPQHALAAGIVAEKPIIRSKRLYVFQSLEGRALCKEDDRAHTDVSYCIVGVGRPFVADGQWITNDLHWCGTYTYETRGGTTRTVAQYATDASTAVNLMHESLFGSAAPQKAQGPATKPAAQPFSYLTGFVVSDEGHLITCLHGLAKSTSVEVLVDDWVPAEVLFIDSQNDIALLRAKLNARPLCFASGRPSRGADVTVVGYPSVDFMGWEIKVTKGHINALSGMNNDLRLLQLDASIQPGSSGSPVLDTSNCVLGMVVAKLDEVASYEIAGTLLQNVNYALKHVYIRAFLENAGVHVKQCSDCSMGDRGDVELSESVVVIRGLGAKE